MDINDTKLFSGMDCCTRIFWLRIVSVLVFNRGR